MSSEAVASIVFTIVAGLLTWFAVYLIKNKLNNPDSTTEWGGLIAVSFFALILILLAATSWVGLFVQKKSIDIDADFVGVKSDTVLLNPDGKKVYTWKLECRWNDPLSGRQITFQSEPFEGDDLRYDRSKIKVSVYPTKADELYTVDLSYLTTKPGSGIDLINAKLLKEADAKFEMIRKQIKEFEKDQELRKEKAIALTVMINRLILGGILLLIFIGLGIGGWYYIRQRNAGLHVQELITAVEGPLLKRGWSFSFQPVDRPWRGLLGMLQDDKEGIYPSGFYEIKSNIQNPHWTLEIVVPARDAGGTNPLSLRQWLENPSTSRLKMPVRSHYKGALAIIELPSYFSKRVGATLTQSTTTEGKKYLDDIPSQDEKQLMFKYIGALFDRSASVFYKSTTVHRSGEPYQKGLILTLTNDADLKNQILTQTLKDTLIHLPKMEQGGYGILLSPDAISISTPNASLKSEEVQAMVDLLVQLKALMERS